ncbi:MAG: hypothetical protein IKA72_02480 [Clostridia bacterium]|nr:hypothetical protein [Clostridia bacterium]
MKHEDLDFLRLWDLYSPLLTKTQREITDLYFNYDLSLAEIAEEKGVSRQSVSDCLVKCRKQLEEYDKKLGFVNALDELSREYSAYMTAVNRWIAEMKETDGTSKQISELENRLEKVHEEFGVEKTEIDGGVIFGNVVSREE